MADTAEDLQNALNLYERYGQEWHLKVNNEKSKIVVFSRGRNRLYNFTFAHQPIEVVHEYKFLGIIFSRSGNFHKAKRALSKQATRAMYSLLRKIKKLSLPVDMQIDKTVKPLLLYGCEVCGFGNNDMLERVQLKFLNYILKLKKSTPSNMVYGETGVYPLKIDIETRMIQFWSKTIQITPNTLLSNVYYSMYDI